MSASSATIAAVVEAVREERVWERHMEMASIGATGRGGVNRQALTPEDTEARLRLLAWAAARGFSTSVDAIGNVFIRRAGEDPAASPVVAGSHLDTQPTGGNFDGVYGVLAAFEVLEAVADVGMMTAHPLEAVVWTNEEGARFQPTTMGSAVFAGALPLQTALATTDAAGLSVAQALAEAVPRLAIPQQRAFRSPMTAYLEAHIEQGPILEATHHTIGIVSGIQGLRWFRVEVTGEEAHAGTTPRRIRKDAFVAAVRMVTALQELMYDTADTIRFTVGRFEVTPNSPNTVPGHVLFTMDLRHPSAEVLSRLGDQVEAVCCGQAHGCSVVVTETLFSPPVEFDPAIRDLLRQTATRQAQAHMDMVSGATHDAKYMADLYPSGMLFVPCQGGISHNEAESATPSDLVAGTRVLAEVMLALASR
jgi:beta-ureidopropionase / N-carbamoyl-L-amino-acid hydrolase